MMPGLLVPPLSATTLVAASSARSDRPMTSMDSPGL